MGQQQHVANQASAQTRQFYQQYLEQYKLLSQQPHQVSQRGLVTQQPQLNHVVNVSGKTPKERHQELIGCPCLRKHLCTVLIAPFWCCWAVDRGEREAKAFLLYYLICNFGLLAAIILAGSGLWISIFFMIPLVMAAIRFSCAGYARLTCFKDPPANATLKARVILMVPCYTEARDGLKHTLDSMAKSDLRGLHGVIVAVSDGRIRGKGNAETCEESISSMMEVVSKTDKGKYTEYHGTYW